MPRSLSLLTLLFFVSSVPQLGCKKETKEDDTSEKEEKSEKKKKKSDDESDDDSKSKKKKKADDEESDDDSKSKKKKKSDDDDSSGDKLSKLGVKPCDKYIEKLQECANKGMAAAKDGLLSAAKSSHKAWKDSLDASSASKPILEKSCKDLLKTGVTSYKTVCKGVFTEDDVED